MFPTLHFCLDPHPSVNLSSPPSTVAICKNRGRGRGGEDTKKESTAGSEVHGPDDSCPHLWKTTVPVFTGKRLLFKPLNSQNTHQPSGKNLLAVNSIFRAASTRCTCQYIICYDHINTKQRQENLWWPHLPSPPRCCSPALWEQSVVQFCCVVRPTETDWMSVRPVFNSNSLFGVRIIGRCVVTVLYKDLTRGLVRSDWRVGSQQEHVSMIIINTTLGSWAPHN